MPVPFFDGTFPPRGENLSNEVGFKNTSPVPSSHSLFKANQKSFKQVKLDLKVLRCLSSGALGEEVRRKFDGEILKFFGVVGERRLVPTNLLCQSAKEINLFNENIVKYWQRS